MKKVLLFFLLLIALLINKNMIFAVEDTCYTLSEKEISEVKTNIQDLLNKRAALWNQLFSEKTKLEAINEELKKIVAPPLITYDMEAFREIKTQGTSMERILKVDVIKVKGISIDENEMIIDIEVEWLMEGFEKNYKEKVEYRMTLVNIEDLWKISDYKVI